MKGINKSFFTVVFLAFSLAGCSVYGFDNRQARETLIGFESVQVLVKGLNRDVRIMELTEAQLKTDIELRLRGKGILVLGEMGVAQGNPILYLAINSTQASSKGGSIYNIDLSFWQDVRLALSGESTRAPTWSSGVIGATYNKKHIRNAVINKVDEFLNAWLSVNPKK